MREDNNSNAMTKHTVRLPQGMWERLEVCASQDSVEIGYTITGVDVLRRFVRLGLEKSEGDRLERQRKKEGKR